jgi:hypothetical protein
MSELSLWTRARESRVLMGIAIATVVGVVLWLAYIFPAILASLAALGTASSDQEWWSAWQSYSIKLMTMWFAPIWLGVSAVVFLVLRAVFKGLARPGV